MCVILIFMAIRVRNKYESAEQGSDSAKPPKRVGVDSAACLQRGVAGGFLFGRLWSVLFCQKVVFFVGGSLRKRYSLGNL